MISNKLQKVYAVISKEVKLSVLELKLSIRIKTLFRKWVAEASLIYSFKVSLILTVSHHSGDIWIPMKGTQGTTMEPKLYSFFCAFFAAIVIS